MAVILVVDDDPNIRLLLKSLLEDECGHDVVFAPDGQMAAERFAKIDPDLVITDLIMPKMHGVQLIEHVRALYPAASILAISGKGQAVLDRALQAGASAALEKPLDRARLLDAVTEALGGRDPWKRGI